MSLKSLILRIKGDNKGLKSSLKQSESSVNKFKKTVKKLGAVIAGAFAIREVIRFGKEVVELAAKAEGVRKAFSKLGDPELLASLREATRGTVDDLTLMQKAVQAKNFKIPLSQLATYFKFATNRAIETGKSIDYLVDSVITGIGRKSVLVMDNLGISAVELQEETKRLGDFGAAAGAIIAREIGNAGDVADTTATKIAKINTAWVNFKEKIGAAIIDSGILEKALSGVEGVLKNIIGLLDRDAADKLKTKKELLEEANAEYARMEQIQGFINDKQEQINKRKKLGLKPTKAQINYLGRQMEFYDKHKQRLEQILALIKEKGRIEGGGGGGTVTTRQRYSITPIGGQSGVNLGGMVDTSQLREMGIISGGQFGDAFVEGVQYSDMIDRFNQLLADMIMGAVGGLENMLSSAFEAIGSGNFDNIGENLLLGFADFLSQLGKLLIAFGIAESGFLNSIALGPAGWPIAIAAGAAAIAAAAAIRGAIAGAAETVGGGGNSYGSSYSGATGSAATPQYNSIQVEGVLKGSDIVISSRRYTNSRDSVT